jgi:hypothetical protein
MEEEDRVHRERERERESSGEVWQYLPPGFGFLPGRATRKTVLAKNKKKKRKKKVETVKNKIHTFFQKCMAQKYSGIRLEFLN